MTDRSVFRRRMWAAMVILSALALLVIFYALVQPACMPEGRWIGESFSVNAVRAVANGTNSGADLLQQTRMADAAEHGVALSRCEVASGAFESALLFFTVLLALIALYDSRSNSKRELRAYVFVDIASLFDGATYDPPQPNFENVPGVSMSIKNSGQTPAHDIVHWAGIDVIGVQNERTISPPDISNLRQLGWLPAGGVQSKAIRYSRKLIAEEIAAIRAGQMGVYLYGVIRYRDIFGETHHTKYRLVHTGSYPPSSGMLFTFCTEGNEAD